MKKGILITLAVIIGAASFFTFNFILLTQNDTNTDTCSVYEEHGYYKQPKDQRIKDALEWRMERLINLETGEYNVADYYAAIEEANQLKSMANSRDALNLEWELVGPDDQGGRTRAILFNQNTAGHVIIGGVAGGLFESFDHGQNWQRIESYDGFATISCIAQASDGTIYVGTGEGLAQIVATSGNTGSAGNGIWKSSDMGATWEHLPGTAAQTDGVLNTSTWAEVNRVAVHPTNPDIVIAATASGLSRSIQAGTETMWNSVATGGRGQDVDFNSDGTAALASIQGVIRYSTDDGATWTPATGLDGGISRAEVAYAPNNPNVAYVLASNGPGCFRGLYRSSDAGATFTKVAEYGAPFASPYPDPFVQPTGSPDNPGCQGWYDNILAVNPIDSDKVYIGGIGFYVWGSGTGGLKKAALIHTENAGRPDDEYIHADKHSMAFDPFDETGNTMMVGTDGGIYYTSNAYSGFPDQMDFVERNKNYNTTQFYGVGAGKYGDAIGGTQDNGSMYVTGLLNTPQYSKAVSGGDGVYGDVSHIVPSVLFVGIVNGDIRRSINGGESVNSFTDANIDPSSCATIMCSPLGASETCGSGDASFVFPFLLSETENTNNPELTALLIARDEEGLLSNGDTLRTRDTIYPGLHNATSAVGGAQVEVLLSDTLFPGDTAAFEDPYESRYFTGSNCGVWMCANPVNVEESPVWYRLNSFGSATSIAASSDADVVYMVRGSQISIMEGLNFLDLEAIDPDGCSFTCLSSSLTTYTHSLPVSSIEGVAVDPNNKNHVLVVGAGFGGTSKVARITNALSNTPTIETIQSNLPIMPLYDCVISSDDPDNYILGTELGIWTSDDAGQTWTEENTGMGRTPVYRLRQLKLYEEGCDVLYAGTHGKGIWRSTSLIGAFCKTEPFDYPQTSIQEIDQNIVADIHVYPNPVTTSLNITFDIDKPSDMIAQVIDMTGRVIYQKQYAYMSSGYNTLQIEASSWQPGNYVVSVSSSAGKAYRSKVVVKQ